MATGPRSLWKGAISFGLVHIPVSLHSATRESGIDFDWLDKRSMDPVGYKRINKKTGKEITQENIVKGIAYEEGSYVVLTDAEITAAYPKSTQSIDIEAFVSATEIPFVYLDRPYYLAPIGKGKKVYALLRETLLQTGRVGVAKVVIQSKQHLAVLVPSGPALVLNLLRWAADIRDWSDLDLPPEGADAVGLTDKELSMATQLVDDMTSAWTPDQFRDSFKDEVMDLVDKKVKAGQTEAVEQPDAGEKPDKTAEIIDLTEMLQRSLKRGGAKADKPGDAQPAGAKNRARESRAAAASDARPTKTSRRKPRAA
jgi:DNA end-binding protein Ku